MAIIAHASAAPRTERHTFTDVSQLTCLYVIEVAKNRIKVGVSGDPVSRLATHRGLAEAHGCKPGREWMSPRGSGTVEREAALIAFCAARPRSKRFRSEYFGGVPFLVAVQHAAELCGDEATLEELAEPVRRNALKSMARPDGRVPRLATREKAAQWLQISQPRVSELIASGDLQTERIGPHDLILVVAIAGMLESPKKLT